MMNNKLKNQGNQEDPLNHGLDNIPLLRFPEFEGAWEVKRLGEVVDRVTTKNKVNNSNVLTISAQFGLISQLDYFNKSVSAKNVTGYYLLGKNDFAYNKSYSKGYPMGAIKRLTKYDKGVVSTLYICFRNKEELDDSYAEHYFEAGNQNREIQKVAQEGARNHGLLNIGLNDFFSILINFPSLKEQKKIAHFFTTLDQKISQLQKKKSHLEAYKKGMMQRLFALNPDLKDRQKDQEYKNQGHQENQEKSRFRPLRFKKDNGKAFPEWEEKTLGEAANFFDEKRIPIKEKDRAKKKGIFPYYGASGIIDFIDEYLFDGEYIFLGEDGANIINRSTKLAFLVKGKFWVNNHAHVFQSKGNNLFLAEYLETINYEKYNTGTVQPKLNVTECKKIPVPNPSLPEQKKIANFLTKITQKINTINQQIEKTKTYKKGLLQRMFV